MPASPTRLRPQPALALLNERCGSITRSAVALGLPYGSMRGALVGFTYPSASIRRAIAQFTGLPETDLFTNEVLTSEPPVCGRKPKVRAS